jgi:hypothetical protein
MYFALVILAVLATNLFSLWLHTVLFSYFPFWKGKYLISRRIWPYAQYLLASLRVYLDPFHFLKKLNFGDSFLKSISTNYKSDFPSLMACLSLL